MLAGGILLVVIIGLASSFLYVLRSKNVGVWLWPYALERLRPRERSSGPTHVMFCFVDHFEPQWGRVPYEQECARVERWHRDYPEVCRGHRDADGRSPIHTFFYPAEEYRREHLEPLVDLCRRGFGEIEIHLHHEDDTEGGLRESLRVFTRTLHEQHDCLPTDAVSGKPRWGFIHGNWALDNARPDGKCCGVDNELSILREEGCYADFTYRARRMCARRGPSIRFITQAANPGRSKSHDRGTQVRVGGSPSGDLMIIQGPLGLLWRNRKFGLIPRIDNADVRTALPPTPGRVDAWVRTGIHVQGRPEWVFVKVHTHGTQERDIGTLLGPPMQHMLGYLESAYNDGRRYVLHYVSAREAYNIAKAAEAGSSGNPNQFRDFEIARPSFRAPIDARGVVNGGP